MARIMPGSQAISTSIHNESSINLPLVDVVIAQGVAKRSSPQLGTILIFQHKKPWEEMSDGAAAAAASYARAEEVSLLKEHPLKCTLPLADETRRFILFLRESFHVFIRRFACTSLASNLFTFLCVLPRHQRQVRCYYYVLYMFSCFFFFLLTSICSGWRQTHTRTSHTYTHIVLWCRDLLDFINFYI